MNILKKLHGQEVNIEMEFLQMTFMSTPQIVESLKMPLMMKLK